MGSSGRIRLIQISRSNPDVPRSKRRSTRALGMSVEWPLLRTMRWYFTVWPAREFKMFNTCGMSSAGTSK
eukprot:3421687-Alexandrium_andersonii.AAC.1